jgi:hypothetical protein
MTTHYFLPWVREGLSRYAGAPAAGGAARGTLPLQVSVDGTALPVVQATVAGPADIVGIDQREIVRIDPAPGSHNVPPTVYPCLDLDSPSLPWVLTPEGEVGPGRRRPWLCLVVARLQPGVSVRLDARHNVTVLEISGPASPAAELPDLATSWAWAHVQVSGELTAAETLAGVIGSAPERAVARLVCPTPLLPDSRYYACLVPTFRAGVVAALGGTDPADLADAWSVAADHATLPAYFTWEFGTGPAQADDFAGAVLQLHGRRPPAGICRRPLDLAVSGLDIPPGGTTTATYQGAFRVPLTPPPGDRPAWVRSALAARTGAADPTAPPLYGGEQAGETSVAAADPGWLAELNLDPRHRAVAALGALVVRQRQEELVAAAWTQAGEVAAANRVAASARVADTLSAAVAEEHLTPLVTSADPAVRAVAATVASPLGRASVQDPRLATTYRRLSRPRGPFARAAAPDAAPPPTPPATRLADALDASDAIRLRLQARVSAPAPGAPGAAAARSVGAAAVSPATTSTGAAGPDPAPGLLVAPTFPAAMFGELAALAPHLVLPGLDRLEQDTVTLLETNPQFVLACLAGMNTEVAQELRWREFPVDPRATFFRHLWDRRGQGGSGPPADAPAIAGWDLASDLETVARTADVGARLTLVVRSRLLTAHPRTAVYAVRAVSRPDGTKDLADETVPGNVAYPFFAGSLLTDIRFFGFSLTEAGARSGPAGPGYFFVFQQQLTETRFGPGPSGPPALGAGVTSADVAVATLRRPVRVAIHADDLLPT